MNKVLKTIVLVLVASGFLSSCATICGGSKYYAQVLVPNKPTADIVYQGEVRGTGSAFIMMKRKDANKFSFTVREKGCAPQIHNYTSRAFRGWALAGTLITWTGFVSGIYIPWGLGVDLATGALWKPNVAESGVVKVNSKNFKYVVSYSGCPVNNEDDPVVDAKVDIVYLKNGSIIKGTLMEPDSSSQIKIKMKDGSIFVFKLDEVLKIE
jgi:hypothetical protein